MIRVDKGKCEIKGDGTVIVAEMMLTCHNLKTILSPEMWEHVANLWIEEFTSARIYETEGVTAVSKDAGDLTIGLAYVLREISEKFSDKRDRIIKLAFELGDDMEKFGSLKALKMHADEIIELEESG